MDYMERITRAAQVIQEKIGTAEIAVILGSGLGDFGRTLSDVRSIPYGEIPGFPHASVQGHAGVLSTGVKGGKRILVMNGRFHAYEGHPMEDVTLPIRAMAKLGVKKLIVTNAAGAVNTAFYPGDLMLITDFINLSGMNPLIGKNLDAFGPRFPDMSNAFSKELRMLALSCAKEKNIPLQQGVYTWMSGPCYETPAEIRMVRTLGGDAVGMSTVPETIVANHSGMQVLGISCLTNMAAGVLDQPINHQEVMEMGLKARDSFATLVETILEKMEEGEKEHA